MQFSCFAKILLLSLSYEEEIWFEGKFAIFLFELLDMNVWAKKKGNSRTSMLFFWAQDHNLFEWKFGREA